MRFRNTRLRTKITAMLVSLITLWAFAAWVTIRDGLNLLSVATLHQKVGRPTIALVTEIQRERRLSMVYVAVPTRQQRQAVLSQRARTDKVQATFRSLTSGDDVARAAAPDLERRISETYQRLDELQAARQAVDAARVSRDTATKPFNDIIDSAFRVYVLNVEVDDKQVAKDGRTLVSLTRANELLSREDALLSGVLAGGRFENREHAQFIELVGIQRFLHSEAAAELPEADRGRYFMVVNGAGFTRLQILEDRLIHNTRAHARLPVAARDWRATVDPALTDLEQVVLSGGDDVVQRARPGAIWTVIRLALAGGLGLLAVIASIVVAVSTARALVRQLERLRDAAHELSDTRLPDVVERLGRGEDVDVAAEAPPLKFGSDQIGQVGEAFNTVQRTAIAVAVEQAELRRGIRDMLLSLARRSQALVQRQLKLLDVMERRELDPTELEDLFRVDHLATRMRRNAENLIILSGEKPARGWRKPQPMVDVLRSATGEVEDYTRVNVVPPAEAMLAGRAVADVIHLVAELIENATSFSPSYTVVMVSGHAVASGYAIEIEDRGLGMTEAALQDANEQIRHAPELNLSRTTRLGLFVVGRLANRYGIRVSLKQSPYGGTTAVIVLPAALVVGKDRIEPAAEIQRTTPPGDADAGAEPSAVATLVAEKEDDLVSIVTTDPADGTGPLLSDEPAAETAAEPETTTHTPSGLPVRVPQASLAPQLNAEPTADAGPPPTADDRSPEKVRQVMSAVQTGTRRGRTDAAQATGPTPTADDTEEDQR